MELNVVIAEINCINLSGLYYTNFHDKEEPPPIEITGNDMEVMLVAFAGNSAKFTLLPDYSVCEKTHSAYVDFSYDNQQKDLNDGYSVYINQY